MHSIQIDAVHYNEQTDKEGIDGTAIFLILTPCQDKPCDHVCLSHPGMKHMYEGQHFRRGSWGFRIGASEEDKRENRANVWGWNGDKARPTLTPSFLGDRTAAGLGYRLHSFLTDGKLVLCGDSTVVLHPNPVPCRIQEP